MVTRTRYANLREVKDIARKVWDVEDSVIDEMLNRRLSAGDGVFTAHTETGFVFARECHDYIYGAGNEPVALIEMLHSVTYGDVEELTGAVKDWATKRLLGKVVLSCPIGGFNIFGGFEALGFRHVSTIEFHEMEVKDD